jgi:hypothetical protein
LEEETGSGMRPATVGPCLGFLRGSGRWEASPEGTRPIQSHQSVGWIAGLLAIPAVVLLIVAIRCGIILMICRHWLRIISPSSKWVERVENLFEEYLRIPLREMWLTS